MFVRRRQNLGAATLTATVAAAALVAGLTTAPSATAAPPAGAGSPSAASSAGAGRGAVLHWTTLITGDRVGVDRRGRITAVDPAPGRERIPIEISTERGRSHAVPFDAGPLIARGVLDRRLFDVTGLTTPAARRSARPGLKLIVAYEGAPGHAADRVRSAVRGTGAVTVRRTLPRLGADAVTVPRRDATAVWDALTRTGGARGTTATPGVRHIWLDAVRTARLDRSGARIGAPAAWSAGLDGTGVTIAVLDTGVDARHPDLAGRVAAARNFTDAPGTEDRYGHGTHVASIAAGTGVRSGRHRGIAPGARLLNAKVLDDSGGGEDSGIIAGMEWAVAQGADVINMSLGGQDTPEVDPLEASVNALTERTGVLFAVSAGNGGPDAGTVGSPGSADAALTVGAVDDDDRLADFSSTGPRIGDEAVKPDVTAPGVDTTAASAPGSLLAREVGEGPAGYLSLSGTSMAAPHAAGAAALLKQKHPGWRADRLKAVLTGSARDGGHTAFQQGTGRIAVDRAIGQRVVADRTAVDFGRQLWPHTDDRPLTREITYRNLGDRDLVLDLTVTATGPGGAPAPAGFFTLGADRVTVPAGGTAAVALTVDTRLGGTDDGHYTAAVTASGGGQSVRTAAAVHREVESYDLTLAYTGRDGRPGHAARTVLTPLDGDAESLRLYEQSGTTRVRLPKGGYVLHSLLTADPTAPGRGIDRLVRPTLALDRDTTVAMDARTARPVVVTVPDPAAESAMAFGEFIVERNGVGFGFGMVLPSFEGFGTAHLGPAFTDGTLSESWGTRWLTGRSGEWHTAHAARVRTLSTGWRKAYRPADFATVTLGAGSSAPRRAGDAGAISDILGIGMLAELPALPATRVLRLGTSGTSATGGTGGTGGTGRSGEGPGRPNPWQLIMMQYDRADEELTTEAGYHTQDRDYRPGRSYRETLNTGVHAPLLDQDSGVYRQGDQLYGSLWLFADGRGNPGDSLYALVRTTLHRGATKVGENREPLSGGESFTLPAQDARYTLATTVKRHPTVARTASRMDASWTFRSRRPADGEEARLPVSTVRFHPALALDSTAPAGRRQTVPFTVHGPAKGAGLKSLTVSVSYDNGRTWRRTPVVRDAITVRNPARGQGIALRALVTDRQGNTGSLTVHHAWRGR
ncbi:S8 family serine peptidase [Streptomyces sp. NPDC000594]|uniref:S8 family peptidase n=1 Tax=Streptomyces sp. NPDC000594 TaxID=3154261 RepID=UPI003323A4E6